MNLTMQTPNRLEAGKETGFKRRILVLRLRLNFLMN